MFIPLHDANSLKRIRLQYVTIGLIAANVLVFVMTALGPDAYVIGNVYRLGYIPSVIFDHVELPPELALVPEGFTYVTYAFLHADIMHLGGNMLFLWVFGDNVEDALGHVRFLIFYVLCAVAGAAFHGLLAQESEVPLIGASGAVAGVVTAYLILHPRVKIWILAFGRLRCASRPGPRWRCGSPSSSACSPSAATTRCRGPAMSAASWREPCWSSSCAAATYPSSIARSSRRARSRWNSKAP